MDGNDEKNNNNNNNRMMWDEGRNFNYKFDYSCIVRKTCVCVCVWIWCAHAGASASKKKRVKKRNVNTQSNNIRKKTVDAIWCYVWNHVKGKRFTSSKKLCQWFNGPQHFLCVAYRILNEIIKWSFWTMSLDLGMSDLRALECWYFWFNALLFERCTNYWRRR